MSYPVICPGSEVPHIQIITLRYGISASGKVDYHLGFRHRLDV